MENLYFILLYLLSGVSLLFLAAGFVGLHAAWRRRKGE